MPLRRVPHLADERQRLQASMGYRRATIAGGIETAAQATALVAFRGQEARGCRLGRPLSARTVLRLSATHPEAVAA